MADARMCDCCKKVFGFNGKKVKPKYRLFIRDNGYDYYDERVRSGMSEYTEPELCPDCEDKLTEIISKSDFGKIKD